jgi:hypothetical protein
LAVPAVAIKLAATVAVTWLALTNVVGSAVPFHWTAALEAKPPPFTVIVKLGPPAVADDGAKLPIVGEASVIVNGTVFETALAGAPLYKKPAKKITLTSTERGVVR